MMTLANIGFDFTRHKDSNSAKTLSKSLQIRNRAELSLEQCLKTHYRITDEKRNSITELITDYYSRIPFDMVIWNKYQVKQCIIDSILLLDTKFDPYKAREAFKLIEAMLINLVYLPWHQEFRKIRTYSGKFVMSISEPLVDVVEIFKAAGFKHQQGESKLHLVLPETMLPFKDDSESVTGVIFDCLVAQVVLTNIIDVYESCLKAAKQTNPKLDQVNTLTWIQAYFRERCYQTTDTACVKVQDTLDAITDLLSRNENLPLNQNATRTSSSERALSQPSQPSERSDIVVTNAIDSSSKISAQERTRKFLAQQPKNEDRIEQSLLRIPPDVENHRKVNQPTKYIDEETFSSQSSYSGNKPWTGSQSKINHDQHTGNCVYSHQQAPRHVSTVTGSSIFGDETDHRHPQPMIDHQHNDKELLIPKSEKRSAQSYAPQYTRRNNINRNINCDSDHAPVHNLHSSQNSRHRYLTDTTSHPQIATKLSNAPSKHEYSLYTKYEPRHTRPTIDGLHWACSSCTYNNNPLNEVCEMCRLRRPSI